MHNVARLYAAVDMENTLVSPRLRQRLAFSRLRIALTYFWRHHCWPDIDNPQTFTEHVQHRKLFDRDLRMPKLADKVLAKQIVAERLGPEWVIPTYWEGSTLPEGPIWPAPFVVKARHGCNQTAFVWDDNPNWSAIRRNAKRWMAQQYGVWLDEWVYSRIKRGILVEPYIGEARTLPIDYKFYVFGGNVQSVQVHLGRGARHRWLLFDRSWKRVSAPTDDPDPQPPQTLPRMIEAAEVLGSGFDFARVDLYEVGGRPLFGEVSFYPGSGLDRFDPVSVDMLLGSYWTDAKVQRLK